MRKTKIKNKLCLYLSCAMLMSSSLSMVSLADEVTSVNPVNVESISSSGPIMDITNSSNSSESSDSDTTVDVVSAWRELINSSNRIVPLPTGYHYNDIEAYSYNDLAEDINMLKVAYPSMWYSSLGQTVDGRELYVIRVGSETASKKIFVSASIHAREYITSQLCMRQVASLLEMQKTGATFEGKNIATLLQDTAIYFVPMANPDGVNLVQYGLSGIGSETLRQNILSMAEADNATDNLDEYLLRWKSNANGVNLNKNFDANWDICNDAKGYPSRDEYKGSAAESEIETKALADFIRQGGFSYTISYHTQGEVIYWKFSEGGYIDKARELAQLVSKNSTYAVSDYYSETDAGGLKDWAEQKLNIPSVTVECGLGVSPVEEEQINDIWNEQKGVLPELLGMM